MWYVAWASVRGYVVRLGRSVGKVGRVSPYIHPPLKVVTSRHYNWSERDKGKVCGSDMSRGSRMFSVEVSYKFGCVDIVPRFP